MRSFSISFALSGLLVFAASLAASPGTATETETRSEKDAVIEFTDVRKHTADFMHYHETIQLTGEQEAIKRAALTAIPAACCSNNSAYTCCCVCNLSRTVWGLTAYLITEKDAGVEEVQTAVRDWIQFVNPDGYSGDTCYTGGCMRSFENNGCGGMRANHVVW